MNNEDIRTFIEIASQMLIENEHIVREDVTITEQIQSVSTIPEFENQATLLVFKLRAYQDTDTGDYAAGMEAGMSRAADMLEHMLERLKDT